MTKEEILARLEQKGLTDIVDLVADAEKGYLEELELVEQVGLVHDTELNDEVLNLLKNLNVKITYVVIEEDEDEAEDEGDNE